MTRRTGEARSDDALGAAINDLLARPRNPFGLPVGPFTSFVKASPGSITLVDPSLGDVLISLPEATQALVGQLVGIRNAARIYTYAAKVTCHPNDQIDGFIETRNIELLDVYYCYAPRRWTRIIRNSHEGGGTYWAYIDKTLPAGIATSNLVSLWNFDGTASSLSDRSGVNANNLTISGTERYAIAHNLTGLAFDGSTTASAAGSSSYRITGELTVEMICLLNAYSASADQWYFVSAAGETEATNNLYQLSVGTTGVMNYFSESGGGVDANINFPVIQHIGDLHKMDLVRDADGDVTLYVNGRPASAQQSAASPTGGTSALLTFGTGIFGTIFSVRISTVEMSALQIWESYRRCRGEA